MRNNMLDLYTDYLITSTSYTTATGLSKVLDNRLSHDKVARFLKKENLTIIKTKNELFREQFLQAIHNELAFSTVLADIWFGNVKNIKSVSGVKVLAHFHNPMARNRKAVGIGEQDDFFPGLANAPVQGIFLPCPPCGQLLNLNDFEFAKFTLKCFQKCLRAIG